MIDIHSHLLPDIDDGSRSASQSVDVLCALADQGVQEIVLTPHVRANELASDADDPVERRAVAFEVLRRANPPEHIKTHLGFEIMLDQPLPPAICLDRRFALAGSRYYLVEFPYSVVASFARRALADIASTGAVPVVAHPERYEACSPETIREWRLAGAKIQLDATTLTRTSTRGHRARQLLATALADVIAGDNHGDARTIVTGADFLVRRGAHRQAQLLATDNPASIVSDGELTAVPEASLRESLIERWKRLGRG